MIRKQIVLPILTAGVISAAVFGGSQIASAESNGQIPSLAQMIAQKFNLDQGKVQAVVDQYRQEQQTNRQQTMQTKVEDRLNRAVSQGKITTAQKQAILDELAKIKSEYNPQSFKNMTADQRRQTLEKEQAEIKSWAKSQGIDPSYLKQGFGIGRGGHWGWNKNNPAPTKS